MEAKTDAHSPQPTRHFGDSPFSAITAAVYEPVLFASQISTSELLGPAVLLTALRDQDRMPLLSSSLALCPLAPWQAFRFLSFYRIVIELSFVVIVIELPK